MTSNDRKVAIVGAGIGGLSCARSLRAAGFQVRVFDKGRSVGGRTSVRRSEMGAQFDHGAQYFSITDPVMADEVQHWLDAGVIVPWNGRFGSIQQGQWTPTKSETSRYVGLPGMSSIAKHLAKDLEITSKCLVTSAHHDGSVWQLIGEHEQELGTFDSLVLNAPAPQSAALVCDFPEFAEKIRSTEFAPCWAVLLAFEQQLDVPWDGAVVEDSPLAWIARNSSKPGRPTQPDCWVLHASAQWSAEHLEDSQDVVIRDLLSSFWSELKISPRRPILTSAHRWRFSTAEQSLEERCLFDAQLALGACGDWCGGSKIEDAYLSGLAMAEAVISRVQ